MKHPMQSTLLMCAAVAAAVWTLDRLPLGGAPAEQQAPHTLPRQGDGQSAEPRPQSDSGDLDYRILIGNIEHEWQLIFREIGRTYRKPVLVLYNGQTSAGCTGRADARMGPFYCPEDEKIYVPSSISREVEQRSDCQGASCRFAQAVVTAHEFGHHIQNILGLMREDRGGPRMEQQADCLAGLWARHEDERLKKEGKPPLVESGDIEAALRWQHNIGDDVMGGGRPIPRNQSHGTGTQRQQAFRAGWGRARSLPATLVAAHSGLRKSGARNFRSAPSAPPLLNLR